MVINMIVKNKHMQKVNTINELINFIENKNII